MVEEPVLRSSRPWTRRFRNSQSDVHSNVKKFNIKYQLWYIGIKLIKLNFRSVLLSRLCNQDTMRRKFFMHSEAHYTHQCICMALHTLDFYAYNFMYIIKIWKPQHKFGKSISSLT